VAATFTPAMDLEAGLMVGAAVLCFVVLAVTLVFLSR
jgi:hypothetical protein